MKTVNYPQVKKVCLIRPRKCIAFHIQMMASAVVTLNDEADLHTLAHSRTDRLNNLRVMIKLLSLYYMALALFHSNRSVSDHVTGTTMRSQRVFRSMK